MPNPKRKHSKARRDKRRSSNSKLCVSSLSICPQCKKPRMPHKICPHCGYYNGKPVIAIEAAEEKKK
ncbi:MAG: 50S ribosomal protein L32 [Candidatus Omnitrophica bacterium]|nr:50S ribosomal protein L32 [Candidatus Omnitrophota bacterium]